MISAAVIYVWTAGISSAGSPVRALFHLVGLFNKHDEHFIGSIWPQVSGVMKNERLLCCSGLEVDWSWFSAGETGRRLSFHCTFATTLRNAVEFVQQMSHPEPSHPSLLASHCLSAA